MIKKEINQFTSLINNKKDVNFDEYVDSQPDSFFEPQLSVNDELTEVKEVEVYDSEDFFELDYGDECENLEKQDECINNETSIKTIKSDALSEVLNFSVNQPQITRFEEQLEEHFSVLDEKLEKLRKEFDTKLMIDEQKDKVIDNLHRELQQYKNYEIQDRILPLVRDLIGLIDNLEKQCVNYKDNNLLDPQRLLETLQYTAQDVEDILYRQGIEAIPVLENEKFDSKRHKVLKTVKTTEKEKDRQIAIVYNKGFVWNERIIRQEQVAVYVHQEEITTGEK